MSFPAIDQLDVWVSAVEQKKRRGRGSRSTKSNIGLDSLRLLILDLAVTGKLLPNNQDFACSHLNKLLASLPVKRKHLRLLEPSNDVHKIDFVPNNWKYKRLGEVAEYIQRGKGPKYDDNGHVRIVSQKCIQSSGFEIERARYISENSFKTFVPERYLKPRDILWNSTGTGTVGRANMLPQIDDDFLVADSHVTVVRVPVEITAFIHLFLLSHHVQSRIDRGHPTPLVSGTTNQVELNTSSVVNLVVPLPPLEEQKRIVVKVDELMGLIDDLEAQTETARDSHAELVDALLRTLVESQDPQTLTQNWNTLAEHFDTLFTTEESVEKLKATILDLAVRGSLTKRQSSDISASLLVEELKQKVTYPRAQKIIPSISTDEVPFEAPLNWVWERLGNIGTTSIGLTYSPKDVSDNGVVVLRSSNIKKGKLVFKDIVRVKKEIKQSLFVNDGDLLICARNGSRRLVGKTASIKNLEEPMTFGAFMAIFRCEINGYIDIFLNSPVFRRKLDGVKTTTINQITQNNLRTTTIPIPPFEEQQRIVFKVDELMVVCDSLLENIRISEALKVELAESVVHHASAAK